VPALMAHRFFKGRIAGYIIEMEQEATLLLDTIDGRVVPAAVAPAAAGAKPVTAKG
ncbi:MotA/TolQ/ExbB proton channel family protein, partial [Xanthomonas perforans]|nr:MotA/TolQ/ExbB proton channel family protein [Xanthomonas perforans]